MKVRWKMLLMVSVLVIVVAITLIKIVSIGKTRDDGKIVIGFLADNLVIERWQRDQEIFLAKAMSRGVEVIVHNANESNEIQNEQIRAMIKEKVDVLVVIPYDKDGLVDAISEARKAGIRVIAYDRLITGAEVDAYISFDNVKVGELQAKSLLKVKPSGDYMIINGSPDDNNTSMFNTGYYKGLQKAIDNGDIRIVSEVYAENWREEPAYNAVSNILSRGGHKIDGIIGGANDRLAEAAITALAEEGLAGEVYVAGHDADISACQRIVEGTQHMTVYKPIRDLAETAVDLAIRLANEEQVHYTETINNGYMEVPFIKLDVLEVTKETLLDTVVADGFHREEDIYRK